MSETHPGARARHGVVTTTFGRVDYVDAGLGSVALFIDGLMSGQAWVRHDHAIPLGCRYISAEITLDDPHPLNPDRHDLFAKRLATLTEFLDRLAIDQVDLFANARGARMAMAFGYEAPRRLRSLSLIGIAP